MGKIHQLPPEVINLIAAGEVVERPASVVKELVENSIDAGASQITIRLQNGGLDLIEVEDNGSGMVKEDAILAFSQHATSKLSAAEDLEAILTLGFRGEALASISAVADIVLETKASSPENADNPATKIEIKEQKQAVSTSARSVAGTQLQIKNIFKRVPARRKFLRTAQTELNHITETFIGLALMNLSIRFELYHNNRLLHRLPPTENLGERVFEIWPKLTPQQFYSSVADQNGIRVELHIGKPEIAQKGRKYQYIFVNKRAVSDRLLQKAVTEAYGGFIHRHLQPVYFVNIQLPPEKVDVNVHPRKSEVKYANPGQVYSIVLSSIRNLLTTSTKQDILERTGRAEENTFSQEGAAADNAPASETVTNEETPDWLKHIGSGTKKLSQPPIPYSTGSGNKSAKIGATKPSRQYKKIQASLDFSKALLDSKSYGKTPNLETARKDPDTNQIFTRRPLQIFNTYIVYTQNNQVIFVDQHAAAEKILYEKLAKQIDSADTQPLLVPEVLEFSGSEKEQILAKQDELAEIGLKIADFGGNSIQVSGKPALTPHLRTEEFLLELINDEPNYDNNPALMQAIPNPQLHLLVATAACHGSVRAGQRLSEPEMQQIIEDLQNCDYPYNCPHGRPVSWQLSRQELEKNFKRVM